MTPPHDAHRVHLGPPLGDAHDIDGHCDRYDGYTATWISEVVYCLQIGKDSSP